VVTAEPVALEALEELVRKAVTQRRRAAKATMVAAAVTVVTAVTVAMVVAVAREATPVTADT
jgi:hypothetical protein